MSASGSREGEWLAEQGLGWGWHQVLISAPSIYPGILAQSYNFLFSWEYWWVGPHEGQRSLYGRANIVS